MQARTLVPFGEYKGLPCTLVESEGGAEIADPLRIIYLRNTEPEHVRKTNPNAFIIYETWGDPRPAWSHANHVISMTEAEDYRGWWANEVVLHLEDESLLWIGTPQHIASTMKFWVRPYGQADMKELYRLVLELPYPVRILPKERE